MELPDSPSRTPKPYLERRLQPRHPVESSAVIHLIDLAAVVHGHILDVSLGGCCIHTDLRFPLGIFRKVETEFRIDGLPFRLGGVTQAIYDRCTVGIRFLNVSERKKEQLAQLIEEVEEMREREKAAAATGSLLPKVPADEPSAT
ncbi:MAG: PilZ domain-containing protein [Terracidiphilus sp.]